VPWVALTGGTRLTLDSNNMVLGDAGTGTGTLSIDGTSALLAGNGANPTIAPFTPGQLVTVTNAGTIDLTNGAPTAANTLTIMGNYVGAGGALKLNTVLGADGSPSDKLVISGPGATATGATGIRVNNVGGAGAQTASDGILVVQAANGATTAPGSFSLSGTVAAGAFEYFLFKGGATGANPDNWYLRSSMLVPAAQTSALPEPLPSLPQPEGVPAGFVAVPLIRPEVAVHSVVPETARHLGLITLATFHERQGDQALLVGDAAHAGWARVFGESTRESFAGGVDPRLQGAFGGLQGGSDVWRFETADGARHRLGFYVAEALASVDVNGFVRGMPGAPAGRIGLDAISLGGYWTRIAPNGAYLDAVLQGSFITGSPHSSAGFSADVSGSAVAASLEGGYPFLIAPGIVIEPQAQAIWQHLSLDGTQDAFSSIDFASSDVFTGRLGARLQGTFADFGLAGAVWRLYLKANLWWSPAGSDAVTFATDVISTHRNNQPAVEIGGGISGRLTRFVSLYGDISYLTATSGEERTTIKGNIGVRVTW
jgi:autotransporter family porin